MTADAIMIACKVVVEEMRSRIPDDLPLRVLDPALHVKPERLRDELQRVINEEGRRFGTVLLGYGLCSRAVEGLKSDTARIVLPRVDDCIGLFLGSRSAHLAQIAAEPGTFFLSRGWIDVGSTPFGEYEYMIKRFGSERADRIMKIMLQHYTRLALIDTELNGTAESYRRYAQKKAIQFGLRYEEIRGKTTLWDEFICMNFAEHFLVVPPGQGMTYEMFVGADE
jgi:hypothetical protein